MHDRAMATPSDSGMAELAASPVGGIGGASAAMEGVPCILGAVHKLFGRASRVEKGVGGDARKQHFGVVKRTPRLDWLWASPCAKRSIQPAALHKYT